MKEYTFHSKSLHLTKVILILSVLYMLIFLTACPRVIDIEEEWKTFSMTGTVTDANSGLPIADATVQIYYENTGHKPYEVKSTKTDQEGQYYMEYQGSLWIGDPSSSEQFSRPLRLRAMAEGYTTMGGSLIQNTELLQTKNFQLPPIISPSSFSSAVS